MKLLIVDDHPMATIGLKSMLGARRDKWQLESASDVSALRQGQWPWDLVLLDMHLPGENFADLLVEFAQRVNKIILISASPEPELVERARARGARGLLLKTTSAEALLADLDRIVAGERVFNDTAGLYGSRPAAANLSPRQREVYEALRGGLSNKQIARKLDISEHTVKEHVAAVLATMGARSRLELVLQEQKPVA